MKKTSPETRITSLEVAILLTILGEKIAQQEYYERVNPVVHHPDQDAPKIEQSDRLKTIRQKFALWIPSESLVEFLKFNPHLEELYPPGILDDAIAKQKAEDEKAWDELQDQVAVNP